MDVATAESGAFEETDVFLSYFKDLADPRQQGKVSYPLPDEESSSEQKKQQVQSECRDEYDTYDGRNVYECSDDKAQNACEKEIEDSNYVLMGSLFCFRWRLVGLLLHVAAPFWTS